MSDGPPRGSWQTRLLRTSSRACPHEEYIITMILPGCMTPRLDRAAGHEIKINFDTSDDDDSDLGSCYGSDEDTCVSLK